MGGGLFIEQHRLRNRLLVPFALPLVLQWGSS